MAAKLDKLAVKRSAVVRSIGGGLRFSENSIQSLKVKVCPIGQSCFVVLVMSVVIMVLVAAVYVVAVVVVVVVGVIVVVGGVGPIVVVVVSVVVVAAVDVDISKNVWKPIVACPNPIIWVVVLVQAEVWWLQKSTPWKISVRKSMNSIQCNAVVSTYHGLHGYAVPHRRSSVIPAAWEVR